ncbi:DUF6515 family protein [Kistimonas asteriae]|uniref:DUF6515 family protein n=1 Tax=Kistimonas asteriae TaxID=517724 RepID=UPI001BAD202B|nr:DUF6515 family protein [Kistimonas asteriae]
MSLHRLSLSVMSLLLLGLAGIAHAAPMHGVGPGHRHPAYRPGPPVVRPAIGVRVAVLPVGWRSLVVAGATYYVVDNVYYQRQGGTYIVVEPPVTVVVPVASPGPNVHVASYTSLYVKGKLYYYRDGVFYDRTSSGQYRSVPAPAGAVIDKLPAGAVEVRENNRIYWKASDTWYEPIGSSGETVYRVVR